MRKSIPNGIWAVGLAATHQLVGLYAPLSGHRPKPGSEDGGMMHDGGGGKIGGRGVGGEDFYNRRIIILIDHGGRRRPTATWGPTPGLKHTTTSKHTMEQVYVVKTRKKLSSIMFIS